ncbi:hypothetical protein F5148DRAFT_1284719 [Russula earlei]|uniref:Uncharacterized protein n=1 Tax=Russula earlei TaxID=71964 RepID=A0ACC0U8H0_9AGAM|nr:hypothetical protein F5148DRAFT_1284719 [Russula earlei]
MGGPTLNSQSDTDTGTGCGSTEGNQSAVTWNNQSGEALTLILPCGWQDEFPTGDVRSFVATGRYNLKDEADPLCSFIYNKGTASVDLSGNSLKGGVTFKNTSGSDVTLVLPNGEEPLQNDSSIDHSDPGTYTVKAKDDIIYSFLYHKGVASINLNDLS